MYTVFFWGFSVKVRTVPSLRMLVRVLGNILLEAPTAQTIFFIGLLEAHLIPSRLEVYAGFAETRVFFSRSSRSEIAEHSRATHSV